MPEGSGSTQGAEASVDTAGNLAVTRRVTVTRLVAGGVILGLLFKKAKKHDSRELYLVVETPEVVSSIKCDPNEGMPRLVRLFWKQPGREAAPEGTPPATCPIPIFSTERLTAG